MDILTRQIAVREMPLPVQPYNDGASSTRNKRAKHSRTTVL